MPIFELDDGRPRLVQPMQPLAGSFAQEVSALLTHHLAAIAGEPLFVVRTRGTASDRSDLPEILALDARGRTVVVDVAQVLDDDAIITALRHGGAASRMTTTDLSRAYHADPGRFAVDYAAFREHVPYTGAQADSRDGVRLVLLCAEVAAEATDSLGFLRGYGRQVDVLQVGVVRGDERRLLEVSALALHEGARRTVEPTALRLVRSSEAGANAVSFDVDRSRPRTSANAIVEGRLTGELKSVSAPPRRSALTGATPIGRRGTATEPTPLPFRTAGPTASEPPAEHVPHTPGPGEAPRPGGPGRPDVTEWPRDTQSPPPASTFAGPPTLTPIAGLRMAIEQGARPSDGRPADPRASTSRASAPAEPTVRREGRAAGRRSDPSSTDVMAPLDPPDDASPEGPRAYVPERRSSTPAAEPAPRPEPERRTSAYGENRSAGPAADRSSSYDRTSPDDRTSSYGSTSGTSSSYDPLSSALSSYEPTPYEPTSYDASSAGPSSYDTTPYTLSSSSTSSSYEPTALDAGSSYGASAYSSSYDERPAYDPSAYEVAPYEPLRIESGSPGLPSADEPGTGGDPGWARPELATLAKRRRAVTTLVWARERRNQRFTAMLRTDGLIELEDGSVHADPDAAAAVVSGAEGLVDGWRSWRLGDGGPTLAEATGHP